MPASSGMHMVVVNSHCSSTQPQVPSHPGIGDGLSAHSVASVHSGGRVHWQYQAVGLSEGRSQVGAPVQVAPIKSTQS
jgi:hypothetical protein